MIASAALTISLVSAAVSMTGLVWQLTLYRLSGARLSVRLKPIVLNCHGHTLSGPDRGWREPSPFDRSLDMEHGSVDLAAISVVNVGRVAINVEEVSLDFGRERRKPWHRYTISGIPVPVHDGAAKSTNVRLDPGASITVYVDHTPLIDHARSTHSKFKAVRASARGAGRRPTRSAWRRRWRSGGQRTWTYPRARAHESVDAAFREVFRIVYPRDLGKLYEAWVGIGALRHAEEGTTRSAIRDELVSTLGDDSRYAIDIITASSKILEVYDDAFPPLEPG